MATDKMPRALSPIVEEAADTALTVPYLDAILFVLGIRREDVEAADSLDAPD